MKKTVLRFSRLLSAKGYIDPSFMTFTIQAVAGVAIAIGAAVGVHAHNVKKKLAEKMNIDENRNKEVEGDDIIVTDTSESD